MNQFSAQEKAQYCEFVMAANGSYVLKPVKVPTHVRQEREQRIRRREISRHVERNRRRAQALSGSSVLFLSAVLVVFVIVCCLFLGVQNRLNVRMNEIASLRTQIETLSQDNDIAEKRLMRAGNIREIEQEAREQLGMGNIDSDQIVYYSSDVSDYMLQYSNIAETEE